MIEQLIDWRGGSIDVVRSRGRGVRWALDWHALVVGKPTGDAAIGKKDVAAPSAATWFEPPALLEL